MGSLKSPTPSLSLPTRWSNATLDTESTWLAALCTEVMSCQRMSTLQSEPSRPRGLSDLSTGLLVASKLVSTTNHQPSFLEATWQRFSDLFSGSATPPPLLKLW